MEVDYNERDGAEFNSKSRFLLTPVCLKALFRQIGMQTLNK